MEINSQPSDPSRRVRLDRLVDLVGSGASFHGIAQIEAIFFASSNIQQFADAAERNAFRERWLGRYLDLWPEHFFIAATQDGRINGYLAGCLEDPAQHPVFADIAYMPVFTDLSRSYPAHLHINLDPGWRGAGIGTRLIDAFCAHASHHVGGVHVVTGRTARNVSFYERNGFRMLRATRSPWSEAEIAFLGRPLVAAAT